MNYNVDFEIPNILASIKSLNEKLLKDVLVIFSFLILLLFLDKSSFRLFEISINLSAPGGFILYSFLTSLCLISLCSNFLKLFILYRLLDNVLKYSAKFDDDAIKIESEQGVNVSVLNSGVSVADQFNSFIISDNLLSDILLTGAERHPSLRRLLFIEISIFFIINIVFFNIAKNQIFECDLPQGYSKCDSCHYFFIIAVHIILFLIFYYLVSKFLIYRSAKMGQRQSLGWQYKQVVELADATLKLNEKDAVENPKMQFAKSTLYIKLQDFTYFEYSKNYLDDTDFVIKVAELMDEIKINIENAKKKSPSSLTHFPDRFRYLSGLNEKYEQVKSLISKSSNIHIFDFFLSFHGFQIPDSNIDFRKRISFLCNHIRYGRTDFRNS